jgi:hypothetical protein
MGHVRGVVVTGCYLAGKYLDDETNLEIYCHPLARILLNDSYVWDIKPIPPPDWKTVWTFAEEWVGDCGGFDVLSDCEAWKGDRSGTAIDCVDFFNFWDSIDFSTGANADRIVRMHASSESGNGRTLDIKGQLRHHGATLSFYGALPVPRPQEKYELLDEENPTASEIARTLNRLISNLAALGLIEQGAASS